MMSIYYYPGKSVNGKYFLVNSWQKVDRDATGKVSMKCPEVSTSVCYNHTNDTGKVQLKTKKELGCFSMLANAICTFYLLFYL